MLKVGYADLLIPITTDDHQVAFKALDAIDWIYFPVCRVVWLSRSHLRSGKDEVEREDRIAARKMAYRVVCEDC